jgi:DNA ligase-1
MVDIGLTNMTFRPMRAPGEDPQKNKDFFKKLRYPLLCSPKFDGVRGISRGGVVTSRSGKPLPSQQVQCVVGAFSFGDGEIIVGEPTDFNVYNRTQSHVMSGDKHAEDLRYYIFDCVDDSWLQRPFYQRLEKAAIQVFELELPHFILVDHHEVETYDELIAYEEVQLAAGYEGIMMRDPVGHYKQGQGTFNEGLIYKLKRFTDAEATIIGFVEQNVNTNDQERSELGYAKRSTAKDGMLPANTLGKFIVDFAGLELTVGCGSFNHTERKEIWDNQETYLGTLLKFRFFSHGVKDLPRFPRATGFRTTLDL